MSLSMIGGAGRLARSRSCAATACRTAGARARAADSRSRARNVPLAGADAIEWGTRNVDRFILGAAVRARRSSASITWRSRSPRCRRSSRPASIRSWARSSPQRWRADDQRRDRARRCGRSAFWIIAAQAGLALMGVDPGRSGDGHRRPAIRRGHRRARLPAHRRGARVDRRGVRDARWSISRGTATC